MKKFEYQFVQELSRKELEQTNGGIISWVIGVITWYLYNSLDDVGATHDALKRGWDAAMN